jgi:hypothetical protein
VQRCDLDKHQSFTLNTLVRAYASKDERLARPYGYPYAALDVGPGVGVLISADKISSDIIVMRKLKFARKAYFKLDSCW